MARLCVIALILATLALGSTDALSQTVFSESEPNSSKTLATTASGMASGDSLAGTAAPPDQDYFRVSTATSTLGIYEHVLDITSTIPSQSVQLRGLNQINGVIGSADRVLQLTPGGTANPRARWYGFGSGGSLYVVVSGVSSTPASTDPYTLELVTTPITPSIFPQTASAGSITLEINSFDSDAELWVYDSSFSPIPGYNNNDDPIPGPPTQCSLTRSFSVGSYYLAIARSSFLANNLSSPPDDSSGAQDSSVADFAGVLIATGEGEAVSLELNGTSEQPAQPRRPIDRIRSRGERFVEGRS